MENIFSVQGKVILVTGSTRGLGWAMAQSLGQAGAHVVLHGRTEESCVARMAELEAAGHAVSYVNFPMEDHAKVADAIDQIVETAGSIWGVVNNAGMGLHTAIEDEDVETYQKILAVHAISPFQLIKAAANHMKSCAGPDRGRIVNVSSIAYTSPRAGICNYTTAKAAIVGFTRAAAAELGPNGINVNAVAPGYFRTDNTEFLYRKQEFREKVEGRTPADRWGEPHELAAVVQFLVSPASSYVNGQCLGVDGGMSHFLHKIDQVTQD